MPPPHPAPQDDETADAAPVGGDESTLLQEPQETALSSRLSVHREVGEGPPPRLVLHLTGDLDADTAPVLREDLTVLAAHSTARLLVLNLSGITFCDTPGLYTLLALRQTLPLADVDVLFTSASPVLRAAADRAGLTTHLALEDIS